MPAKIHDESVPKTQSTRHYLVELAKKSAVYAGNTIVKKYNENIILLPTFIQAVVKQEVNALTYVYGAMLFVSNSQEAYKVSEAVKFSSKEILKYTKQSVAATPYFIGNCMSSAEAPPIFSYSSQLARSYLVPVLLADYIYYSLENFFKPNDENTSSLVYYLSFAPYVLFSAYTILRTLQLQIHTNFLLMKLPDQFHKMKKNITEQGSSVCLNKCDRMGFTTGELRAIFLFWVRKLTVSGVKKIPYVGLIASPLQMMFLGLAMTEYRYISNKTCEEHRNINFEEYGEWFFTFGVLFQASIYFSTLAVDSLALLVKIICERYLGELFLLSPMLAVFNAMPKAVFEEYFGSVAMLFLVGLSYYVPLPTLVEKSTRSFYDLRTRSFTNWLMNEFTARLKSMMKNNDNSLSTNSTLDKFLSFLDESELLKPNSDRGRIWNWDKSVAATSRPSIIKFFKNKLKERLFSFALTAVKKSKNLKGAEHSYLHQATTFFVPSLFRDFQNDQIVLLYLPGVMVSVDRALSALINSRQLTSDIFNYTDKIDSICSKRAVQWGAWLLGIGVIPTVLTFEFMIDKGPKYLDDFLSGAKVVVGKLPLLIRSEVSPLLKILEGKINALKKNMKVIEVIKKEVSKPVLKELIGLLNDEDFLYKLGIFQGFLTDFLMQNKEGRQALGYNEIDSQEVFDELCFDSDEVANGFHNVEPVDEVQRSYIARLCEIPNTDGDFFDEETKEAFHQVGPADLAARSYSQQHCISPVTKCEFPGVKQSEEADCIVIADEDALLVTKPPVNPEAYAARLFRPATPVAGFEDDIPPGNSEEFKEKYSSARFMPAKKNDVLASVATFAATLSDKVLGKRNSF